MNKNVMIAAMIAAAALMLALVAPVSAQFSPLVMHKARILDVASRVHKDARPLSMVLPGGGRVSPTEETFEAMRSMMESTSTKKLVLSAAQQAGGNNLTLFSSPNSCNATSTSIDLTLFSGMYGKCLSYPSGSIILALCNSMAGGTTSFTLGQFMLPNCPNTDKNATVLFAAGAPTDKTGCFTMTVVTPTVSATLGAQVKCPPA